MPDAANKPARKRVPKQLAVINADSCTGCEACVEICPVDCIELRQIGLGIKGAQAWCEVDLRRCIGCKLCVRLPQRSAGSFVLSLCPWEAIEMVPTEHAADLVRQIGGPPEYKRVHLAQLVATATEQAHQRLAATQ